MSALARCLPFGNYDTGSGYANCVGQDAPGADFDSVLNSNAFRRYRFVKNSSGSTLAAAFALKWKAGKVGQEVDLPSNGDAICGYTPYLVNGAVTNTIPDGAYFWMIEDGPTTVATDGAAISEGDLVEVGSTAGKIKTAATALAANSSVRGGRAMEAAAARGTGAQVYVRINAFCRP